MLGTGEISRIMTSACANEEKEAQKEVEERFE